MTRLRQIRHQLLSQHDDIRDGIDEVRAALAALPGGATALLESLHRLGELLHAHNLAEEDALASVLPKLDAFGDVRKGVMLSDHRTEHQEMRAALVAAAGTDPGAADKIGALLDRLVAHMEHEENLFLSARLLAAD